MNKLLKIGETNGGWSRTGWLQLEIGIGYAPPFWYGLAWWHPMKMVAVCYPIPLNWVLWLLREIYWKLKSTPNHYKHPMWIEGHQVGYEAGIEMGVAIGRSESTDQEKFDVMWKLHKETSKSST